MHIDLLHSIWQETTLVKLKLNLSKNYLHMLFFSKSKNPQCHTFWAWLEAVTCGRVWGLLLIVILTGDIPEEELAAVE